MCHQKEKESGRGVEVMKRTYPTWYPHRLVIFFKVTPHACVPLMIDYIPFS